MCNNQAAATHRPRPSPRAPPPCIHRSFSSARRGSTRCASYPSSFGGLAPPPPLTRRWQRLEEPREGGLVLVILLSSGATPRGRPGREGEARGGRCRRELATAAQIRIAQLSLKLSPQVTVAIEDTLILHKIKFSDT
jgi:hypothetical protein